MRRLGTILLFLAIFNLAGCVISPRRDGTTTTGGGTGTGHLYVSNQSGNEILTFAKATGDSGSISATAVITGLSNPQYIFSDKANDRLYVANLGAQNILVFNSVSTLTGTASVHPARTISSPNFSSPTDVTVDTTRDLMYVADNGAILVFAGASGLNGTVPATAIISPGFTPDALLIDSTNNILFAANSAANAIDIFDNASTLNGTLTTNVVLVGSNTGLNQPDGLQIDGAGRLIVSNAGNASISIYTNATTINGNISPVTVIGGGQTTLVAPAQIAVDPTTNAGELYIADTRANEVAVFSNITTAVGNPINASPNRNITGITTPRGVAIDVSH